MELVGKKVTHNKFGEGTVIAQDAAYVSVEFMTEYGVRKFSYPLCFKTFLKLTDVDAATQIDETVKKYEKEECEKKKQAYIEAQARQFTKQMHEKSLKTGKEVEIKPFDSVEEFCSAYKRATIAEIVYLKTKGGKRQPIFDGKRVEYKSGHFVYTFEADEELNYPDSTPISIWRGEDSIAGHIVGCEEFTVIIATNINLGEEISQLEFSAEPWHLLNSLNDRLDEMLENPSKIVKKLICDGRGAIDYGNHKIEMGQETAVQMSKKQPITFVWGPPGTGKTETLAKIALEHIREGKRVLMLSYSNVSVDGAIMRVYKRKPDYEPGTIVRYGYARDKQLLEHEYLTSYNLVIRNYPSLLTERKELITERRKTPRTDKRYVEISRRLTAIRDKLIHEEQEILKEAKFVATTVSKAIVDGAVRDNKFDVVIFDEASMAYIPQIVFAAGLATEHFVCMGDFRQLPPIVQSSGSSPLNADIFQYCGISKAVDKGVNHKWLCMLNIQHRMHPKIAEFVSRTMYSGLLHSDEAMEKKCNGIVTRSPIAGHAISLADLSGMMSVCTKTGNGSRVNVLSALISFSLALEAAKEHTVGIITPYYAQSRLLYAMSRDVAKSNPELKAITCATVHQFQGSEQDVIIYDAVDCYRMPFPGVLLTSTTNNYANRLFNVALTRAKGKFIGVANVAYMENKNLSKNLMFERMIEGQRRQESCLTGEKLVKEQVSIQHSGMSIFKNMNAQKVFMKDLSNARREIRIDIPDKPLDDAFLKQLTDILKNAKEKGVKVYIRAENKQTLPVTLKGSAIENTYVANPLVLIDKVIVWFGMPLSDAMFKSEGRFIQTKYRPIIRFEGSYTAKSLYGYMDMSKTEDQSKTVSTDEAGNAITENFANYVLAHKRCPICGKPMRLRKNKKGNFFIACTGYPSCKQTALVTLDFVEEYLCRNGKTMQKCSRCKYSLEAKMGPYGIYIQCCSCTPHKFKLDEI